MPERKMNERILILNDASINKSQARRAEIMVVLGFASNDFVYENKVALGSWYYLNYLIFIRIKCWNG